MEFIWASAHLETHPFSPVSINPAANGEKHQEEEFWLESYKPVNRYLILSITFQRTHLLVPVAAPARDNTVETQRPEQQPKGEVTWSSLVPAAGGWEGRGHLWCLTPVTVACCGQCGLTAEKGLEEKIKGVVSAFEDDPDGEAAGEPHICVCAHMCHAHTHTHILHDQPSQECCRTQPLNSHFPADGGVGLGRKVHQARKSSCRRHPAHQHFCPCHHRASNLSRYKRE